MSEAEILEFIAGIKNGKMSEQDALKYLKNYPFNDIGCAKIDTQRTLRNGTGEVIYGANKTDDEILQIASAIGEKNENKMRVFLNAFVRSFRRQILTLVAG